MNKRDLVTLAALMGALGSNEPYGSLKNPYSTPAMKCKESKPLREFTWKGHTIMAYSKTDARNRIMEQMRKENEK